jgi:hypothetical protein
MLAVKEKAGNKLLRSCLKKVWLYRRLSGYRNDDPLPDIPMAFGQTASGGVNMRHKNHLVPGRYEV